MREVVGVVELIDRDLKALDESRRILSSADQDRLNLLKSKTHATLSNLMTASKNHAMSFGVSPVSLLDAAASHLSATVVDLIRLLKVRRTSSKEHGRDSIMANRHSAKSSNTSNMSPNPTNSVSNDTNSSTLSMSSPATVSTEYRPNPSSTSPQDLQTRSPRVLNDSAPQASTSNSDRYDNRNNATTGSSRSISDSQYNSVPSSRRSPLLDATASRMTPQSGDRSGEASAFDNRAEGGYEPTGGVLTYGGSPQLNESQSTAFSQNLSQRDEDESEEDRGPDNWDEVKVSGDD